VKRFLVAASAIVVAGVSTACQRLDAPAVSTSAFIDGLNTEDATFAEVLVEAGFEVDADNLAGFTRRAENICSGFAGGTTFGATVDALGESMSWQQSAALARTAVTRYCPDSEGVVDEYFRELEGRDGGVASETPPVSAPASPILAPALPLPPSPEAPSPGATLGLPCTDVGIVGLDTDGGQFVCGAFADGSVWVDIVPLVGIHEASTECDPSVDGGSQTSARRAVLCVDGTWQFGP
jgi:Protein of unknown function (DUF732)